MSEESYIGQANLRDAGLDSLQRAKVLEWFAEKIWVAQNEGSGDRDYHCKSYGGKLRYDPKPKHRRPKLGQVLVDNGTSSLLDDMPANGITVRGATMVNVKLENGAVVITTEDDCWVDRLA